MAELGTVLVVDDEVNSLNFLFELLSCEGYTVEPVASGEEALKIAERITPDVIILDFYMTGMDGVETCRRLQDKSELKDTPILFISGSGDHQDKHRAFEAGGVDYVTKPFEPQEVLMRIKVHHDLARSRREIEEMNVGLTKAMANLKSMQAQLIHSEKMATLGTLTTGLAHEINNPVNFISSGVKAFSMVQQGIMQVLDACDAVTEENAQAAVAEIRRLKETVGYDDLRQAQVELLESIETGVKRISEVLQGLRMFSKADDSSKKQVALNDHLKAAVTLIRGNLKHEVELTTSFGELPIVTCNASQINQIVINFLTNAIDAVRQRHGSHGGDVHLLSKAETLNGTAGVTIEVRDNGIGLDPDIEPHLMKTASTTHLPGMGVGLLMSKRIVNEHNGELTLEGNKPQGTIARLWLPRHADRSDAGGDSS